MSLSVIQKDFLIGIVDREEDSILNVIQGSRGLSERESLSVYRGSILGHLVKCLSEIYPVCEKIVGNTFFDALATRYALDRYALCADLNQYGANFNEFIRTFPHTQTLPYLADLAQLEWFCERAFLGRTATPISLQTIQAALQETVHDVIFHLPSNASLMSSAYPVHQIWEAHQNNKSMPTIDLATGGVRLLIWQKNWMPQLDVLSTEEYECLLEIQQGHTLSVICDKLSEKNHDIVALLPRLVHNGWIAGLRLLPEKLATKDMSHETFLH